MRQLLFEMFIAGFIAGVAIVGLIYESIIRKKDLAEFERKLKFIVRYGGN